MGSIVGYGGGELLSDIFGINEFWSVPGIVRITSMWNELESIKTTLAGVGYKSIAGNTSLHHPPKLNV